MAADLFLPRRNASGDSDESLASFVRRRLGCEALERMAQPMVGGIYTADPEKLSLRATLPRFLEMEREHRSVILALWRNARATVDESAGVSGARYSLFLSFDRGMQVLADTLGKRIADCQLATADSGSRVQTNIRLNTRVDALRLERSTNSHAATWKLTTAGGELLSADAVCLALPAFVAASLLGETSKPLAGKLRQIEYASTATINFAYRRADIRHPLDGFGFVVPFTEKRSLIACTFSSVKFPGRAPKGLALLRAFVGGALQPNMFALEESEMLARVKADLRDLLGIANEPLFAEVARWPESMPQYGVGHLDRIAEIEREAEQFPGLALAGNSYRGAGIPDCIRSGELAAERFRTYV